MANSVTMCIKVSPETARMVRLLAVLENTRVKDIFDRAVSVYVAQQQESLEILASPDWMKRIRKSEAKFKKKETITHEELKRKLNLEG